LRTRKGFLSRKYLVKLTDHIPRIGGAFVEPVLHLVGCFLTRHQRRRCEHGEAFLLTRMTLRDPFPGPSAAPEWLRIASLPIADGALPYLTMMGKEL
jgi:hypothetical protein